MMLQACLHVPELDPGNPFALPRAANIYRQRNDVISYRKLFKRLHANEVSVRHLITWAEQLLSDQKLSFRSPDLARTFRDDHRPT